MQEIVNLLSVKGTHFLNIQEFSESLSKKYDALVMMGEADMLSGFNLHTKQITATETRPCLD